MIITIIILCDYIIVCIFEVCVCARDISYGTHTGNLHIKINYYYCSDLRLNEIVIPNNNNKKKTKTNIFM